MDFEIECEGHPFRILKRNGRCGVTTDRFFVISTCRESVRSIELKTSILRTPLGKIKVCEAGGAYGFCEEALPELTLSRNGEDVIGSVAFEKNGRDVCAISHFCRSCRGADGLITAIAAASYFYSSGLHGEISVCSSGTFFDIIPLNYGLLIFDRHSSPLTFYAPDIE